MHDYALERSQLFGLTKRNLDMPLESEYDSHHPDKVNYFILSWKTRSTRAHIEEFIIAKEIGCVHIVFVFIFALSLQKRMLSIASQYMTIRANPSLGSVTWHSCAHLHKHEKRIPLPQPCALRFCIDDINRWVKGSKMDSWLAKSSKHLVGEGWYKPNMEGGFSNLEDVKFQVHQWETLLLRQQSMTMPNLPSLCHIFGCPEI